MARVARPTDRRRLQQLKYKIRDKRYIDDAITRIAQKLAEELLHRQIDSSN
jgi:hypothetical protein